MSIEVQLVFLNLDIILPVHKLHVASIYMSLIKCSRKEGRLAGDIG